jgi:hypothetical protein
MLLLVVVVREYQVASELKPTIDAIVALLLHQLMKIIYVYPNTWN